MRKKMLLENSNVFDEQVGPSLKNLLVSRHLTDLAYSKPPYSKSFIDFNKVKKIINPKTKCQNLKMTFLRLFGV